MEWARGRWRGVRGWLGILPVLLLALRGVTWAAVPEVPSVQDLAVGSDLGVLGYVVAVRPTWNEDRSLIISYVTVCVSEALVGTAPGREIVVRVAGGSLPGEDIGVTVSGAAQFQVGEEVAVLLRRGAGPGSLERQAGSVPPFYRVVGGELGKFVVIQDPQGPGKQAVRRLDAVVGQDPGAAERIPLETFKRLVRTAGGRKEP